MKYRKKPQDVEAFQFGGASDSQRELWPEWAKKAFENRDIIITPGWVSSCHVRTLNGFVTVQVYEWIIKGIQGELYPCKDEIFKATYEKVG